MARPRKSNAPPAFGQPAKPAHLSEAAAREWDKLVGEIAASSLQVTPAHRGLLQLAATLQADIKSDWEEIKREGAYKLAANGAIVAHPAVKRMGALRRDLIKALSAIGLRPGVTNEHADGDTLADVLNG
jgi:P27 family predicted phage terminase small subunit